MAPYEARAIDESEVVDQEGEELAAALDPQADFTFSVSFDSMPELRWKRPYREITVGGGGWVGWAWVGVG